MNAAGERRYPSTNYIIENANKMFDNIIDKYGNKNLVISYNTKAFPSISEIEAKLKKKYSNVITKYEFVIWLLRVLFFHFSCQSRNMQENANQISNAI